MRLLFFGMRCPFSPPVLKALIGARYDIAAIVLPGAPGGPAWHPMQIAKGRVLPLAGPPTIDHLAAAHHISIVQASSVRRAQSREAIAALAPDLIVVACFPHLIPQAVVALAPFGGINVHPSLLPAFRGPEPLFWTVRSGLRASGVTVHRLSDRFDAGPVIAQTRLTVPFGERLPAIEAHFGDAGGALVVTAINAIRSGRVTPVRQDEEGATEAPFPGDNDFTIPDSWSVERAYAFARAVAPLGGPLTVLRSDGTRVPVRDAVSFQAMGTEASPEPPGCDNLILPFVNGYVGFTPA